ncbi:MAG TPA: mechanosensitive ion channel family protein [Planctomycetota bacterium]|nr:mechanosensitive ion channel family protein [Planctomycetota bacterium]
MWMSAAIEWSEVFKGTTVRTVIVAVLIAVAGYALLRSASALAGRLARQRLTPQATMLVRKMIFYIGAVILLIVVLQQVGVNLGALLGAAGIAGIAIGFASQTSLSNLVSGIFLISEKPFAVGDWIQVGGNNGYVLSIDLLSVKIRTHGNQYIRIPNETLLKAEVINISRFPLRRFEFMVGVAYKEDVARVLELLFDVARKNHFVLEEPGPLIYMKSFGDSALEFFVGVWHTRTDWEEVRKTLPQEIKERFDAEGIEIPFPHRTLYTGAATAPFPIRIVADAPGSTRGAVPATPPEGAQ